MTTPTIHRNAADALAKDPNALGFYVWCEFEGNRITKPALDAALAAKGFDASTWGIEPVSHHNVFAKSARRTNHKFRRADEDADRVVVFVALDTSNDEATFIAHTSRKRGAKKGEAFPIGTVSLDLNTSAVSWRYSDVKRGAATNSFKRLAGEGDEAYVARRLEDINPADPIGAEEVKFFAASCVRLAETTAERGDKIDSIRLASMMREALERRELEAVRLKKGSGIYFVPNIMSKGTDNPVAIVARLAAICEALNPTGNTVALTPIYRDASSMRAVGSAAKANFVEALQAIEADLEELESVRKVNQITARAEAIGELFARAETYRDVLGLRLDDFDARVEKAKTHLASLAEDLDAKKGRLAAERAEKRKAKREAREAELAEAAAALAAEDEAADTEADIDLDALDDATRELVEEMRRDGADPSVVAGIIASAKTPAAPAA